MADTIAESIEERALLPIRQEVDGKVVEQHLLRDQIAADKYLTSKSANSAAASQPHFGLRFTKLVPPEAG